MSFDPRFDTRWQQVLSPAIGDIVSNDARLEPFRVDLSKASDAILTEILEAIADSQVIVADITAIGELAGRPIRNANVLYEVGLAHAVRLPEEVVLFRSDPGPLIDFDIGGVRVHSYDPDADVPRARAFVTETIIASLAALQTRRRATIRSAAERLTLPAFWLLMQAAQGQPIRHPAAATIAQAIGSVQRSAAITLLLELGAVRTQMLRVTPELLKESADDPNVPMLDYHLLRIN